MADPLRWKDQRSGAPPKAAELFGAMELPAPLPQHIFDEKARYVASLVEKTSAPFPQILRFALGSAVFITFIIIAAILLRSTDEEEPFETFVLEHPPGERVRDAGLLGEKLDSSPSKQANDADGESGDSEVPEKLDSKTISLSLSSFRDILLKGELSPAHAERLEAIDLTGTRGAGSCLGNDVGMPAVDVAIRRWLPRVLRDSGFVGEAENFEGLAPLVHTRQLGPPRRQTLAIHRRASRLKMDLSHRTPGSGESWLKLGRAARSSRFALNSTASLGNPRCSSLRSVMESVASTAEYAYQVDADATIEEAEELLIGLVPKLRKIAERNEIWRQRWEPDRRKMEAVPVSEDLRERLHQIVGIDER